MTVLGNLATYNRGLGNLHGSAKYLTSYLELEGEVLQMGKGELLVLAATMRLNLSGVHSEMKRHPEGIMHVLQALHLLSRCAGDRSWLLDSDHLPPFSETVCLCMRALGTEHEFLRQPLQAGWCYGLALHFASHMPRLAVSRDITEECKQESGSPSRTLIMSVNKNV